MREVAIVRPGAIGDILITLNLLKPYKQANPDTRVTYVIDQRNSFLEPVIYVAGADEVEIRSEDYLSHEGKEVINLRGYPESKHPKPPLEKHIMHYFSDYLGLPNEEYSLDFPVSEPPFDYCTVHVKAGFSNYKNWPIDRWEAVCSALRDKGIKVIQVGGPDDPKLKNAFGSLLGDFFGSFVTVLGAKMHLGVDTWTNHATNFNNQKVPAIILFGSTQAKAFGYRHNMNISLNLPCQPCFKEDPGLVWDSGGICEHPLGQTYENPLHACMHGISSEMITKAAISLWKVTH